MRHLRSNESANAASYILAYALQSLLFRLTRTRSIVSQAYSVPHRRSSTMLSPKASKFSHLPLSTSGPIECALAGTALLDTPYLNKGSGFPAEEREQFKLTGLLPLNVQTLDQQAKRAYEQYSSRQDALAKNTFLTSLKFQNEVLYYRVRVCV